MSWIESILACQYFERPCPGELFPQMIIAQEQFHGVLLDRPDGGVYIGTGDDLITAFQQVLNQSERKGIIIQANRLLLFPRISVQAMSISLGRAFPDPVGYEGQV